MSLFGIPVPLIRILLVQIDVLHTGVPWSGDIASNFNFVCIVLNMHGEHFLLQLVSGAPRVVILEVKHLLVGLLSFESCSRQRVLLQHGLELLHDLHCSGPLVRVAVVLALHQQAVERLGDAHVDLPLLVLIDQAHDGLPPVFGVVGNLASDHLVHND